MKKLLLGLGTLSLAILPIAFITSCAKETTPMIPIEPIPTTPKEDAVKYFNETKNLVEKVVEEQVRANFQEHYNRILKVLPEKDWTYSPSDTEGKGSSIDATTRMFKEATTFIMNSNGDFEMVYSSANLNEITLSVKILPKPHNQTLEENGSVFKWEKPQNDKPFNIVDGKLVGVNA